MVKDWLIRLAEAAAITLTIAAVCQEMEKSPEERRWKGKIGLVPYDFRVPNGGRLKNAYWNPEDKRVFTDTVFGVGWAINFYALMEKLRIVTEAYLSEDDFLMPTPTLKRIMEDRPALEEV